MVSSDGSFAPPEVSPPALVLRARYGSGHDLELAWEWAYRVGERVHRAPLAPPAGGPGVRDLDAERALLAGTVLAGTGLERYGLLDESGRPAAEPVALSGLDSMRFTTEALPLLRELAGVTVEVEGQPPDYRDVGASLEIALSTAEIAASATGSTSASRSASRGASCRSPRCSSRSPPASRTCCSTTAPTSRSTIRACSRCAR